MEEDNEKTFTDYKPSLQSIGPPHPDPVVETSSLSAIQPPEATYSLAIKDDLEGSKTLSCLQIETLVYASQRHLQHLPSGERAGFFIGDGAGVGKGRTIAGLIWENWRQNRRKSLWISIGSDLKFDARRDLDDVGASCIEVHALNKLPYSKLDSKSVGIKEGVIFLTYTSLIAHGQGQNRLQQLTQWCGRDFDGLIIFDECHKAKNLVPGVKGLGTMTGKAVVKIQNRLPQARVVYCSATGASEPRNMAYMVRLGLWGFGTCFPEFGVFLDAMERGGIGALELVAMEMKARGLYVCRTLSQKGAEIEVVEVPLEAKMMEIYEKSAEFWVELKVGIESGFSALESDEKPDPREIWRLYWAHHQHFFKHMCASAKVPAVVRLAKQALMDGKCVVIGLQSTGEARTEEAVSKRGNHLDDFIFGPRELLLKFVEENYPLLDIPEPSFLRTKRHPDVSLRGRVRKVPKFYRESEMSNGEDSTEPTEVEVAEARRTHEEGVQGKSKLLEKIRRLELPNNPLDDIIDQLGGHDQVAEITGRRGTLIKDSGKNGVTYQARNHANKDVSMEMVNMHEKNLFMDGKKLVAIISEAGSAGVSLQADRRAVNQRRRVHLTLELPWSADKTIQQFGRTHRSNQASAPEYRMLITNLGGERRFASIVAKRLATLGALTQGDRRAGGGSLSAYNYESECGKKALKIMYKGILKPDGPDELPVVPPGCSPDEPDSIYGFVEEAKTALVSVGIKYSKMDDEVGRFLNRILGLPPVMQNRLFEWFVAIFDHVTQAARAEGQLDSGILDIKANRVEMKEKPKTVHFDTMSGVSSRLFTFTLDHGTTWESAYALMKARRDGDHDFGFYQSKTENSGRRDIVLALDGSSANFFKIFRPSGESSREMSAAELKDKYSRVPLQIACVGWEKEYDLSPKQCVHGPKCKMGKFCEAIRLREEVNVLSGLIFPIWGAIEKALAKQDREIHRQIRVVRVKASSDMPQPIVGLLIPNAAVETLLQYLARIGPRCYSMLNEAYFSQFR